MMNLELGIRFCRQNYSMVAALVLVSAIMATPASALPVPTLRAYTSGGFFIPGTPVGPYQEQVSATGPVQAQAEGGAVLKYGAPDFPAYSLNTTLFAGGQARADYGINGTMVQSNLRGTSGTDLGQYPSVDYQGNLPDARNSSSGVSTFAESSWRDVFIITGGSGAGLADVDVALHLHAETRYGAFGGNNWYNLEPSLETFGRNGYGFAHYSLKINYDVLPPGLGNEYSDPIRWETSFGGLLGPPVPDFVNEIGIPTDILTGNFAFEYGVPFALSSFLTLSGYNQITIDANHTATLSQFRLPEGAFLTAFSGHLYPIAGAPAAVPEPSTFVLAGLGLVGLGFVALRKKCRRV